MRRLLRKTSAPLRICLRAFSMVGVRFTLAMRPRQNRSPFGHGLVKPSIMMLHCARRQRVYRYRETRRTRTSTSMYSYRTFRIRYDSMYQSESEPNERHKNLCTSMMYCMRAPRLERLEGLADAVVELVVGDGAPRVSGTRALNAGERSAQRHLHLRREFVRRRRFHLHAAARPAGARQTRRRRQQTAAEPATSQCGACNFTMTI